MVPTHSCVVSRASVGTGLMGLGVMTLPRSGDAANGVVADVALIVGVDEVLCGAAEGGEGGDEAGAVGGGVDAEEGRVDGGGIVDGPAEGEGSFFRRGRCRR